MAGPMYGPIQGAIALKVGAGVAPAARAVLVGDGVPLGCASTASGTSTCGGGGRGKRCLRCAEEVGDVLGQVLGPVRADIWWPHRLPRASTARRVQAPAEPGHRGGQRTV